MSELYEERWSEGCRLLLKRRTLYRAQSRYQTIEIFDTEAFGRVFALDGIIMTSEFDEFIYHEMLVHPALQLVDTPRSVLIVGGGDGGAAREVLRYPSVERLELVEIDALVLEAAQRFLATGASLADPRVQLQVADGSAFVKGARGPYDAIIVDASDPIAFAEGLFSADFYRDCAALLSPGGVLVAQSESPLDPNFRHYPAQIRSCLAELFPQAHSYLATIPSYPYALWSFALGSARNPLELPAAAALPRGLRYYTAELHAAAFALPQFMR